MTADNKIELGTDFEPKFDANGLITTISQDAKSRQILMVAGQSTRPDQSGISRDRSKTWLKYL